MRRIPNRIGTRRLALLQRGNSNSLLWPFSNNDVAASKLLYVAMTNNAFSEARRQYERDSVPHIDLNKSMFADHTSRYFIDFNTINGNHNVGATNIVAMSHIRCKYVLPIVVVVHCDTKDKAQNTDKRVNVLLRMPQLSNNNASFHGFM